MTFGRAAASRHLQQRAQIPSRRKMNGRTPSALEMVFMTVALAVMPPAWSWGRRPRMPMAASRRPCTSLTRCPWCSNQVAVEGKVAASAPGACLLRRVAPAARAGNTEMNARKRRRAAQGRRPIRTLGAPETGAACCRTRATPSSNVGRRCLQPEGRDDRSADRPASARHPFCWRV